MKQSFTKRNATFKPALEALEDRRLLAVNPVGPAEDFKIDITAGDTVSVGRTDNFKFRVTDDGEDLPVQQAASSIVKLTITANNNFANTIDLSGINLVDFPQLNQVLVKIDARDTVNRGAGWNPAGSQTIDGQRYAVFTQANATLKITDLRTTPPPVQPPAPVAHGIVAHLVPRKHGRKQKLFVQVRDAVNGQLMGEFASRFKAPTHKRIGLSVSDSNGDGVLDTVVLRAMKGKRPVEHRFSV